MHLSEGEIRAYLDRELASTSQQQGLEQHLQECVHCQGLMVEQQNRRQWVGEQMSQLESNRIEAVSPVAARTRLEARLNATEKEKQNMFKQKIKRLPRLAWVALVVALLLVVSLSFAPARAIANSFLGLFRVQNIKVVQVDPGIVPEQLGASAQFESMLSQDVQYQENGKIQEVASLAEASDLAGFMVRLPGDVNGELQLLVQPGGSASYTVDMSRAQALLDEIGRADIDLPPDIDGAKVTLEAAAAVVAQYGECELDTKAASEQGYDPDSQIATRLSHCTTFLQMPSPTISAPPGLDMQKIGEAYLQVVGMSQKEAERFAQRVDWATTLIVPLPRYATSYREVPVDGVTGTLIMNSKENEGSQYMLVWVKDGIVYSLSGPGNSHTALAIANSLK